MRWFRRRSRVARSAEYEHFGWFGKRTHIVWNEQPPPEFAHLYIEVFVVQGQGAGVGEIPAPDLDGGQT